MKNAIVTTTIYVPKLLTSYAQDTKKHGRETLFVVIGDKKTPKETEEFCTQLAQDEGVCVEYFSVERQETYLARFPKLRDHLTYNSIQRRNIGLLYAYEQGCENIITIDDDNFISTKDFVGTHETGVESEVSVIETSTGWCNVCALLSEKHGRTFYHRGFPIEERHKEEKWREQQETRRIVVNAGLWLGDPDIDALERIYYLTDPTDAVSYTRSDKIALGNSVWSPFNSQNTALAREIIPAYFLSPYIGRYDDIWASYIVKRLTQDTNDVIAFGLPLVQQERNPHNYWKDLDNERMGHPLTPLFVRLLSQCNTTNGKTYQEKYQILTGQLMEQLNTAECTDNEKAFIGKLIEGMRIWVETFTHLNQAQQR